MKQEDIQTPAIREMVAPEARVTIKLKEPLVLTNPVIDSILNRESVRKYTDQKTTDKVIVTVVQAG